MQELELEKRQERLNIVSDQTAAAAAAVSDVVACSVAVAILGPVHSIGILVSLLLLWWVNGFELAPQSMDRF